MTAIAVGRASGQTRLAQTPAASATAAPPSVPLRLDRAVRRHGDALIGGHPRRVLRLTAAGWRAIAELERGAPGSAAAGALSRRLLDGGIAHPHPGRRAPGAVVTVVVPVRDRVADLDRCLATLGARCAVIVVDDGSREAGAVAAAAARHGARLLRRPLTGGPAAARNAALSHVVTELVAFLDSDCVAPPDWLDGLVGHFDDPRVGAVAPRVRPVTATSFGTGSAVGTAGGALERVLAARSPLDMGDRPSEVRPGGIVSYAPTAALVVRRRALGAGFDEALRYGEDVDFVWRLRDAGWTVRYEPTVVVSHREPASLRRSLARRFRYGTSAAPLAARHPGRLAPVIVSPWPTAVAGLALTNHRRAALAIAAVRSAALARRLAPLGLPGVCGGQWFAEATYGASVAAGRYAVSFVLPAALAAVHRARRPAALALLALPALDEWCRRRPDLDPVRFVALAVADDAAYGAGVWRGALAARSMAAVRPALARG